MVSDNPQATADTSIVSSKQVEERLKNPKGTTPESELENLISEEDWEWIEKANHPLGGRLHYGAGFTPQTLELDIKFNLSNHRTRLYQYITLHCSKSSGITSSFTIELLAEKLECHKRDIREAMKELKKRGLALPNPYPKHFTKDFTFILPYVKELSDMGWKVATIENKTEMKVSEIWENRDYLGFPVKSGGEAEGKGRTLFL